MEGTSGVLARILGDLEALSSQGDNAVLRRAVLVVLDELLALDEAMGKDVAKQLIDANPADTSLKRAVNS